MKTPSTKPKSVHEALCMAQGALGEHARRGLDADRVPTYVDILSVLIREVERHRPLGSNGKHGDLHTVSCGCEGHETPWSIRLDGEAAS